MNEAGVLGRENATLIAELGTSSAYLEFLGEKQQMGHGDGFAPHFLPSCLFDFQAHLVDWACRQGKAAIFAECGLGKTLIELAWAQNIVERENRPVLIVAPLAVSAQTVREGEKFGIEARRTNDGTVRPGINVTNYERLHYYNPDDFGAVVCDESSAIKHFTTKRQKAVTEFLRTMRYRLLATATPSPNDYIELGTSSEALGQLGRMDMLGMFFKSTEDTLHPTEFNAKWVFKAHAEPLFWRWVCSWARALRAPSDLGYDDGGFILPKLDVREHIVSTKLNWSGQLWPKIAETLAEQRIERRATIPDRCERAAELVKDDESAIVWCHLNEEGDLLERLIPDGRQAKGSQTDEENEEVLLSFVIGELRVLITKPVMFGFGLNLQHCAHMTMFPSHSFEQYYQAIRRCWRFGQTRPVVVDVIVSEGEAGVRRNLARKAEQADRMFGELTKHMQNALTVSRAERMTKEVAIPPWL